MEKNTNFIYKNLSQFKWFVLENFPFLEADFDALTEWQLFCKIGKEINKIITSQNLVGKQAEELTNAFNDLQNYVNNYFENLDVQNEINNKLNEMAESGELSEIIAQYTKLNCINVYNTVNDLKEAKNLTIGTIAKTLGYYELGDGGSATYIINDTDISNDINILRLNNGLVATLVINNIINVKQFGAKGDGIKDDTLYIQEAINNLKDKDCLYFPKGKNSNYLITDELILNANDVSIYSEPKSEYSTSIICRTNNKTIFLITGYGVIFKNLAFYGNGTQESFSTVNGLNFDRTSLGDNETYSNIDCVIEDCLFFHLNNCITIKGRNARIKNNTFSLSKNGIIGLLHKYNSDTLVSEFRGFYILNNVFHSMNYQNNSLDGLTLDTMNSFCISLPLESDKVGNLQILNNKSEFCQSIFYKGYLVFAQINDNTIYKCMSTFIYSPINDTSLISHGKTGSTQISNNIINGVTNRIFRDNFIYFKNTDNVKISNNNFRLCTGDGIINENSNRCIINNNILLGYGTSENSAINFINGNGIINNNTINDFLQTNYGITSSGYIHLNNNNINSGLSKFNISPQKINTSINNIGYIKPNLQNNFNYYNSLNYGITKYENGLKEINICVKDGIDNGVVFNLPEGYKPANTFGIPCIVFTPDTTINAYAQIFSDGEVRINWGNGNPDTNTLFIIRTFYL